MYFICKDMDMIIFGKIMKNLFLIIQLFVTLIKILYPTNKRLIASKYLNNVVLYKCINIWKYDFWKLISCLRTKSHDNHGAQYFLIEVNLKLRKNKKLF